MAGRRGGPHAGAATHARLDDPGTLALRRSTAWSTKVVVDERVPVLPLPEGSRAGDVRSARSLKRLERYERSLEREHGPWAVELVTDLDGLRRRWPDVQRTAAAADAGRDRTDLCAPPYDRFTLRFLEAEARAGRLLLAGATVGGRWVAHEVALRSGGTLVTWLSRFEPDLRHWSPGHLLMRHLVDTHDEHGVRLLDLGIGENDYKLGWTDLAHDVATVTAVPTGRRTAGLRLGAAAAAGDLVRRVR